MLSNLEHKEGKNWTVQTSRPNNLHAASCHTLAALHVGMFYIPLNNKTQPHSVFVRTITYQKTSERFRYDFQQQRPDIPAPRIQCSPTHLRRTRKYNLLVESFFCLFFFHDHKFPDKNWEVGRRLLVNNEVLQQGGNGFLDFLVVLTETRGIREHFRRKDVETEPKQVPSPLSRRDTTALLTCS